MTNNGKRSALRIHFAGGGQTTEYIARRLIREGHDLVIVEHDEQRCRAIAEALDAKIVHGDANSFSVWREARIADCDLFVACTHSDQSNILAALIAARLAPTAFKAVRLRSPEYADWEQLFAGIGVQVDRVLHPESSCVARILRVLEIPGVSDVRTFIDGHASVFNMNVRADSWFVNRSLTDIGHCDRAPYARACLIVRGSRAIVPHGDEVLLAGDHIYLATPSEHLDQTLAELGVARRKHVREVFIAGGGEIGLELSRSLQHRMIDVKLFERDPRRCEYLAAELPQALVINADGTDQEVLLRENVDTADAYIALTGDDDANLIACLLTRRLGVNKVVPELNRVSYLPLAQRLGINTSVNSRVKTADGILEFIRAGKVLSVRTLGDELAEAIELVAPDDADFVGKPLADVAFPAGTRVGVIARPDNSVVMPTGEAKILAGDRVVFFALEENINQLEMELFQSRKSPPWFG